MKLDNILKAKYAFTIIGGGWGYSHELYAITSDNSVYYTNEFNDLETAKPEFLLKLDADLNFEEHSNIRGCDGEEITMYKIENNTLKELYHVGNYGNIPAYDVIVKKRNLQKN